MLATAHLGQKPCGARSRHAIVKRTAVTVVPRKNSKYMNEKEQLNTLTHRLRKCVANVEWI